MEGQTLVESLKDQASVDSLKDQNFVGRLLVAAGHSIFAGFSFILFDVVRLILFLVSLVSGFWHIVVIS